tara:strand:+ start:5517 stop:5840 length:324 start_codon:yes stop_codon:yes gene_type:complete
MQYCQLVVQATATKTHPYYQRCIQIAQSFIKIGCILFIDFELPILWYLRQSGFGYRIEIADQRRKRHACLQRKQGPGVRRNTGRRDRQSLVQVAYAGLAPAHQGERC